jgi:hypothetical protein
MGFVKVGEPVALECQLFDGATGKFVQAKVIDPSGAPVAGSPFSLPHSFGGLYRNTTLLMPAEEFIVAEYKVYNDAGFTSPSPIHGDALDVYYRYEPDQDIIDLLNDILDIVNNLASGQFTSAITIEGQVSDAANLSANVDDGSILGMIEDLDTLTGSQNDEGAVGSVDEPSGISGELDCNE